MVTDDDVYTYMKDWRDDEKPTDFTVAYDKGHYSLCIYYLCSAGAISPICPISRKILREYKKLKLKDVHKEMDECFKYCVYMQNEHDESIFVPVGDPDLDYFVSIEEWEAAGYKEPERSKQVRV